MEIQWGKNPEYTFYAYFQPRFLALPLQIGCLFYNDVKGNKNYSVSIHFLCFGIEFEIWRWKK